METKHTPGPWEITIRNDEGHMLILEPSDVPGDGAVIADLWDARNQESDARLIAAAPDLLAASKALSEKLGVTFPGVFGETGDFVDALRAAIAKAEGA